jgi:hypothetical protein
MVIFSQDNVALVNESIQAKDVSNNLLEEQEKTQGWFNLF